MPDLVHSLQGKDLGHLRIIAQQWGIELGAAEIRSGLASLQASILNQDLLRQVIEALPADARSALDDLVANQGRLPWPLFTRRYGAVREMGPARRDRERPFQNPNSPAEKLWYRGLVGRAFYDTDAGPQEFAYIPDDLLDLMPAPPKENAAALGRAASPKERAHLTPSSDRLLDHACTLLAVLRLGLPLSSLEGEAAGWYLPPAFPLPPAVLQALLSAASLLDANDLPRLEPVRSFLEAARGEALALLTRAWLRTPAFNELLQLPGLQVEGDWHNDPLRARQAILDFLSTVPGEKWWSLSSFTAAIRQEHPDFQRPAGDYDSWFIKDVARGTYLRGFAHWEAVDGALVRYIIAGPLHWLGIVDLAAPEPGAQASAFHLSAWAPQLLAGSAPAGLDAESENLSVRSDGRLFAPRLAPRAVRYQVARFSKWEGEKDEVYHYRLTPSSLERARGQGLRLPHLMSLLRRFTASVPPSLAAALERWEARGPQARIEQATILRLGSPDLLHSLLASRAARFLGDPLGPTTVIVKPGAGQKVLQILAEMGYLGEMKDENSPDV